MMYGFGIIGCGMIADFHARAIKELKKGKLIGCFDNNYSAAERLAAKYGAQPFADLQQMVADQRVDVVTVCTPSGAHLEPAAKAAQAGCHVIVEKPLEITVRRCERIIAACEKHGVTLSTVFPSRFARSAQLLKSAVQTGRFGRLTLASAAVKWYRTQAYFDNGGWRGTWALDGGGALMNQAIHSVDLLTWMMGSVAEVTAVTDTLGHERIEVEDTAVALLRFACGALGVIEASTAAYPGWSKRIEIHGTNGSARLEEDKITAWQFAKMTSADKKIAVAASEPQTDGGAGDPSAITHAGHATQFNDVLKAIEKQRPPSIDGREGRRSVQIIQAIYKSAATGKPVRLQL
jgi:predicted dehydrogenase